MNLCHLISIVLITLLLTPLARAYYDPAQGRWCSRDPIAEKGGVNLYGFVRNNAIGRLDGRGLESVKVKVSYHPPDVTKVPMDWWTDAYPSEGSGTTYPEKVVACKCTKSRSVSKSSKQGRDRSCDYYAISCTVRFSAAIRVYAYELDAEGRTNPDGVLGHEQKHVLSRTQKVKEHVVDELERQDGGEYKVSQKNGESDPPDSCKKKAQKYQDDYQKMLENWLDWNIHPDHAGEGREIHNKHTPRDHVFYPPQK